MRLLYLDLDTLRPDHLGCYGYHRDTSPTIDRIAPRESWLVLGVDDFAAARERWNRTPALKWWESEPVQKLVKEELEAGKAYRFTYCYRPDPTPSTAYLVANAEGIFALVGMPTQCQWMSREQPAQAPVGATDDDDLDFDMV